MRKLQHPTPRLPAPGKGALLQRKCDCGQHALGGECEECKKKQTELQRFGRGAQPVGEIPPVVHDVLRAPGQPLDGDTRAFAESRFGQDFSGVRIHTDGLAAQSAQSVDALAYTVGTHIVFGPSQYRPRSAAGMHLLAHELSHVVQQSGAAAGLQPKGIGAPDDSSEHEANRAADLVLSGQRSPSLSAGGDATLRRSKGDYVAYSGGQSGILIVIENGKVIGSTQAVSGNPGSSENEVNVGPIPTGTYTLHPANTNATVSKLEGGTCGAGAISSGLQQITSNDPSPCKTDNHYCTVPCASSPVHKCFTPRDCWGESRMRIEGSINVRGAKGGTVTRGGFFIHGGNHDVAVTSGCVKVSDNSIFDTIRTLKGAVPLCVGDACPDNVRAFLGLAQAVQTANAVIDAIEAVFP